MRDRRIPIVDQLDGPATLILDPHKDDARAVARGELLIRFIPLDQNDLKETANEIVQEIYSAFDAKVLASLTSDR